LSETTCKIISPYGGQLINLVAAGEERKSLLEALTHYPSIQLSPRALCDLELLATGAFSPLDRFMGKADYQRVLTEMRLNDGNLFPIPITLTINKDEIPTRSEWITLRNARNFPIAVMRLEEFYRWDPLMETRLVYSTVDHYHPMVSEMIRWGDFCVSGELKIVNLPSPSDFTELRHTPAEVRRKLEELGHENVVAFQTRNPMHRVHEELTRRSAEEVRGSLLLHPTVGMTKPGDVDYYTRVRIYKALYETHYDQSSTVLSLLPLAMRMAGPREALWHAIIRRNYGANHFIVGRDHAGPGKDSNGNPFYGSYEAQEFMAQYAEEIGVTAVPFKEYVYVDGEDRFAEKEKLPANTSFKSISGTAVREEYLAKGKILPEWFTRPEIAVILAERYPPRHKQGFAIWFTGLSGSGKSTTAEALTALLLECGRSLTVLDGDVVRTHLSKGLGFTAEDRNTNILRIGFVAGEIVRHGGAVVCAAISPYRKTRNEARKMVGENFIEVFVDASLEVCEERDTKGLYAKARRGEIKGFTGIDDPYEAPASPDIVLDTVAFSPVENAMKIIDELRERGLLVNGSPRNSPACRG